MVPGQEAKSDNLVYSLEKLFLFYHETVCCVFSIESLHRGDSVEYTQHTSLR